MKQLILLLLLMFCCKSPVGTQGSIPVSFEAITTNKHVENEEFKIFNGSQMANYGKLPLTINANTGDILTAEFEVHVTNFNLNHPQCDCEQIEYAYYRCKERYVVDGADWDIAQ